MALPEIDAPSCILLALGLLVLPLPLLFAAVTAAGFHEICHFLAAKMLKIPVFRIRFTAMGCIMELGPMGRKQELICAAAGPLGSLLLFAFYPVIPLTGLCAGIQGLYNLLPVYPLDGGRILRCLVSEKTAVQITTTIRAGIFMISLISLFIPNMGILPGLIGLILAGKTILLKNTLQTPPTKSTIALPKTKR